MENSSGHAEPDSVVVTESEIGEAPVIDRTNQWQERQGAKVHGYYAWWTRAVWLHLDLSLYDKIFFFSITPSSDGGILERHGWPFAWEGLMARADSANVPVIPTLALLEPDSISAIFLDPASRARLLETSLELIRESDGAGLHVDFEWFEPADDSLRDGFHAWLDSLAARVEADLPEAALSVFMPGLQPDGMIKPERIPDAFSEIMVQGYDMHWQSAPRAGPVAPIRGWDGNNWERIADSLAAGGIRPDRIMMTVPYYGYEWPVEDARPGASTTGTASIVTYARVDSLNLPEMQVSALDRSRLHGAQRDSVSGSPWYVFSDSTGWRQGWYEDPQSLQDKYRFIRDRAMRGVAIFPIGYDASLMDGLLEEEFGTRRKER